MGSELLLTGTSDQHTPALKDHEAGSKRGKKRPLLPRLDISDYVHTPR